MGRVNAERFQHQADASLGVKHLCLEITRYSLVIICPGITKKHPGRFIALPGAQTHGSH